MDDVGAFHAGDRTVFRALVVEHGPSVLRLARSFTRDTSAAEDLFQEIWTKVWERRRQYSGEGSFVGWLHAVARHECIGHHRRQRARAARLERLRSRAILDGGGRSHPVGPRRVERAELRARLLQAMAVLTERQRTAVELRLLEGMGSAEAARLMECSPATVRSLLRHALTRLRMILGEGREQYEVS
jgi:RNA polymerase sigma-70 factor (ECF subfamily)